MKKVKEGEWFLLKPNKKDKRKIVVVKSKEKCYLYLQITHIARIIRLDATKSKILNYIKGNWKFYKLNKKEKEKYLKEIIVSSLK